MVRQLRQCVRHRLPYRTVGRQVRRPCSAARLDRRPGRESLEARAVKTAVPGPVISGSARDANVPELGMVPAEYGLARCNESDSYAGADRSEEHTSELQSRFDLVCR